jgi:putative lipoic acid-binding regulatory protein
MGQLISSSIVAHFPFLFFSSHMDPSIPIFPAAMLNFPVRYTFHAVGKTSDEASIQKYVNEVKKVVLETSGDKDATWEVQKRGAKFTKIKCEVEVQSSTMVNKIYSDISNVDGTVMRF